MGLVGEISKSNGFRGDGPHQAGTLSGQSVRQLQLTGICRSQIRPRLSSKSAVQMSVDLCALSHTSSGTRRSGNGRAAYPIPSESNSFFTLRRSAGLKMKIWTYLGAFICDTKSLGHGKIRG